MPNVYKLKTCPQCNKEHRQRGVYCSISCGNSARHISQETKNKISAKMQEYVKTPEGRATASIVSRMNEKRGIDNEKRRKGEYILDEDDWMVEIPVDNDDDGIYL